MRRREEPHRVRRLQKVSSGRRPFITTASPANGTLTTLARAPPCVRTTVTSTPSGASSGLVVAAHTVGPRAVTATRGSSCRASVRARSAAVLPRSSRAAVVFCPETRASTAPCPRSPCASQSESTAMAAS